MGHDFLNDFAVARAMAPSHDPFWEVLWPLGFAPWATGDPCAGPVRRVCLSLVRLKLVEVEENLPSGLDFPVPHRHLPSHVMIAPGYVNELG